MLGTFAVWAGLGLTLLMSAFLLVLAIGMSGSTEWSGSSTGVIAYITAIAAVALTTGRGWGRYLILLPVVASVVARALRGEWPSFDDAALAVAVVLLVLQPSNQWFRDKAYARARARGSAI